MFKVYSQDSFCFPGCLPEGCGSDSNGDEFETESEARSDAADMLGSIFQEELKVNGDSKSVIELFNICEKELMQAGETSCELPYRDEEDTEVSDHGYRFISFRVEKA